MLITLSLFLIIALFTPAYVRLSVGVYESPILSTVGAFCGIYLVLSLSWLLNKSCYLSYIPLIMGRGSLFILIFHGVIAHRLERVGSKIFPGEESILAIIFTLFSFIACILIPLIIRKVVLRSSILSLVFFPIGDNKLFKKLFKK
jgi:fucose 4-O-acetylase-like acetyltransferase